MVLSDETQQALIEMIQRHFFVNFTEEEENANCCYGTLKELAAIRAGCDSAV